MRSILSILLLALTTTAGAETWVRCGDSVDVAEGALMNTSTSICAKVSQ